MKKWNAALVIVVANLLAPQAFATMPPLHYTVKLDTDVSTALISELQESEAPSVVPGHGSELWTFESLHCEYTYFEVHTPQGGPVIEVNNCVAANTDGQKTIFSPDLSKALIANLDALQVQPQTVTGLPIRIYDVKNLKCDWSQMEIVAPGGGGFQVRDFYNCSVVK